MAQSTPTDFTHDGITLVRTGYACPEQYDAFDAKGERVGYLRLRHGQFTVEVPHAQGKRVYSAVPEGDGTFEDDEREGFLIAAVGAIQSASSPSISTLYRSYIDCLNRQDWRQLGEFVAEEVCHNGRLLGLSGYRAMLEQDFRDIPDLQFNIALLVADASHVACRLTFDCSPRSKFLGLDVNGTRVKFTENVIYEFRATKIVQVWSVIDKAAIEAQLLSQ